MSSFSKLILLACCVVRKVPEGQCLFQDLVLCLGNLGVPDGVSKASPGQQANKP